MSVIGVTTDIGVCYIEQAGIGQKETFTTVRFTASNLATWSSAVCQKRQDEGVLHFGCSLLNVSMKGQDAMMIARFILHLYKNVVT